jgi:hypothetical protein
LGVFDAGVLAAELDVDGEPAEDGPPGDPDVPDELPAHAPSANVPAANKAIAGCQLLVTYVFTRDPISSRPGHAAPCL